MSGASNPRRPAPRPTVLLFVMPFAASAGVKHAEKLIDCLAPNCDHVRVVGDRRIDLRDRPAHVVRFGSIPTLHYLARMRPVFWPALLWGLKLIYIVLRGAWAVITTRHETDVVICFQSVYYTPILLVARLLGKQTIMFEPGNDIANARMAYHGGASSLLVSGLQLMRHLNRALADVCAIESSYLIGPLGLQAFRNKTRVANLYVNGDLYRMVVPLTERSPVVGFVGRLSTGKGIPQLLEAAATMHSSGIMFEVIGDGPLQDEVERALQRPELSHVTLAGWVTGDELAERYNRIRLLVLPSASEGVPNVVLEAMACGTPVLATAVGGIPEIIRHQVTGFSLPACDSNTIADSILMALNHPDLWAIGEHGRCHVLARYSLAASSEKWGAVLEELTWKQLEHSTVHAP